LIVKNPVVLFIPVSSTSGIGEYSRSLVIAEELNQQYPNINIHFLLNKHAKCSQSCPFETHLSEGSATKDSVKVESVIDSISPDLVIFDCSGRARHFKYAKKSGAKVIFISQHEKKRARGLGLARLRNSDKQWVAQTLDSIGPLSWVQKLKLQLLGQPEPRIIGPVFKLPNKEKLNEFLESYQLKKNEFLVFNAGSGGHLVKDELASEIFFETANEICHSLEVKCVVVFGANYPKKLPVNFLGEQEKVPVSKLICIQEIDNHLFIGLLASSIGAVLSGGDTFLQAIELKVNCVVTAVSKDQPKRIEAYSHNNQVFPTECGKSSLISATKALLSSLNSKMKTNNNLEPLHECHALTVALADIKSLLKL
jgi:spore coat polysaccharide biosynthesis predicted glycosyltransferase SpsG